MEIVKATKDNLASVIMGKNIQFPWRGQQGVIIIIPYKEWLQFISKYRTLLQYRRPLNYNNILDNDDEQVKIRYFMYECSWALYNEIAISSSMNRDATLILPYFDDGDIVTFDEAITTVNEMSADDFTKWHNQLRSATKNYYDIGAMEDVNWILLDPNNLSDWNRFMFYVCIYIQSRSSKKFTTRKLNIDLEGII